VIVTRFMVASRDIRLLAGCGSDTPAGSPPTVTNMRVDRVRSVRKTTSINDAPAL